jgi:tetratricopeptide (TPR) repeat protein/glycosyltransferase involved in cell wall biosynthesis
MVTSSNGLKEAMLHHQAGRAGQAERLYQEILQQQPEDINALNMLGALLYQENRYEEALSQFQQVLKLQPDSPDAYNSLGVVLKAQGKAEAAADYYRKALERRSDHPEVLNNLGNALKEMGDLQGAIATYEKSLAIKPNYAEAHNNLGVAYKDQENLDAAQRHYEEAIALKPNYAEAHNNLGIVLGLQGKFEEAESYFRQAIRLRSGYLEAHSNLGGLLQRLERHDEAADQYHIVLQLKPNTPETHHSLGTVLQHQGKLEEALVQYQKALELRPNYPEAHSNSGNVLLAQGKSEAAIASYRQALELRPDYPEVCNNLGNALQQQDQIEAAMDSYRQAIELRPHFAEALSNLGALLKDKKQFASAITYLQQAIALRPDLAEIHNNLGNVYQETGEVDAAIASYQKALECKTDIAEVHSNLGNMLQQKGEFETAFHHFDQAIALQPDFAGGYNNLGIALRNSGQIDAAFDAYDRAIELKPDFVEAHWNKALNYLLIGDLAQGFAGYEWRFRWSKFQEQNTLRNYAQPRWDGTPLQGKTILLYVEQGMGDTIQFIRYAQLVSDRGGHVIVETQPPLVNLLQLVSGLYQVVPYGTTVPFDVHAPLMSLPFIFGTTQDTIPLSIPYIHLPASSQVVLPEPPSPKTRKIGLVWSGNPDNPYNVARTVPLEQLLSLTALPDITFYSLQKDVTAADAELLQAHPEVHDLRPLLNDFVDTAHLLTQLDLVISVDTAVTHLAGALGVPTWLLLPFAPDWRWMVDRPDSPWYPSLRLFRQPSFGNWESVIATVATALGGTVAIQPTQAKRPATPTPQPISISLPPIAPALSTPTPKPTLPDAIRTAVRQHQAGQVAEAKALCRQFLAQQPDYANGWHLLGLIAHQEKRVEEAIQHYRKTIALDPHHYDTYNNLAVILQEQGRLEEAIAHYQKVLALKPDYADAHNNYANALREQGQLELAIHHYRQAIQVRPNYADAHNNLGLVLYSQNKYQESADAYRQAIALNPDHFQAHNHLGNALKELGQFTEAMEHYRQAVALKPDYAKAFNNWGNVYRDMGNLATAVEFYDRATAIDPSFAEAHWNKALTLLLGGDLERGFAEYEWRWHVKLASFSSLRPFPGPRWDGTPLQGKTIFLHAEQGMGDIIQFVRYVPRVLELGGRVILECHPPLMQLFQGIPGIAQLLPYNSPPPPYDVQFPLMSLAHLLGISLDTIPSQVPYLTAPSPDRVTLPPPNAPSDLKVGLVWSGNPENTYNRTRAVPLEQLLSLTDLPNITFYSLQKELTNDDADRLHATPHVHDLSPLLQDFVDTAHLLNQLDVVISVDTAVTHLAGALGRPTWLLLPYAPDWRWMLEREDSPWYPTVQIFRQPDHGMWEPVIETVRQALGDRQTQLTASPRSHKSSRKKPPVAAADLAKRIAAAMQCYEQGNLAEAEQHCRQVLQHQPHEPAALHILGVIQCQTGRLEQAIANFQQVIAQNPNHVEALNNLGSAYKQQGQSAEAIAHYQRAIALDPNYADAHYNLGVVLQDQDDLEAALQHFQQFLTLQPHSADGHYNLGFVQRRLGQLPAAIDHYRRAIQLQPDFVNAHKNLGHALLLLGDLRSGFAEYEWRWQQPGWERSLSQPIWDGTNLAGKTILLHAEQGIGDTIQFIRYVPQIKAQGARVLVECQASLLRLLAASVPEVDQWIAQNTPPPAYDCHAPLLSLPRLLGTELATIPASIPYLTPPTELPPLPAAAKPSHLKVGLVWAGNPDHANDRYRSCTLKHFQPLWETLGITCYSLQKGSASQELSSELPIIDLSGQLHDFADTAGAIVQLDLVITVDTAVAHLAGALGKPVWVLLAFAPDWRWMIDRSDSPWYPTMRLFRQPQPSDWQAVMAAVQQALQTKVETTVTTAKPLHSRGLEATGDRGKPTLLIAWSVESPEETLAATYLAGELLQAGNWQPKLAASPAPQVLHPLTEARLQQSMGSAAAASWVILDNRLLPPSNLALPSANTLAIATIQDTHLEPAAIAQAQSYRAIATWSTWSAQQLKQHGLSQVQSISWGIDPAVFRPGTKPTWLRDRFVILVGGRFDYASAPDRAIAAFKAFYQRHPDALLVATWQLPKSQDWAVWQSIGFLPESFTPDLPQWVTTLLTAHGLSVEAFLIPEVTGQVQWAQVVQAADAALWCDRATATGQQAMESLACGIPTLLSANTAHLEWVQQNLGYPLQSQRPVLHPVATVGTQGWGESDQEEILETLERIYSDRQEAIHRSMAAIDLLQNYTWSQTLKTLLRLG